MQRLKQPQKSYCYHNTVFFLRQRVLTILNYYFLREIAQNLFFLLQYVLFYSIVSEEVMSMHLKATGDITSNEFFRIFCIILGAAIYSIGVNLFVVPAGLYTGGVMGICQILRTLLERYFHFGGIDIAGILYYVINLPLLLLAWRKLDRRFALKTVIAVSSMTLFLSLIPATDVLGGDTLAKCLIGGIISGAGCGIILWMGATSGGMDIIGIILFKQGVHISVGQLGISVNVMLYSVCALLFALPTAIYSIIYAVISAFTIDKLHMQNINMEVNILTKKDSSEMEKDILNNLRRGVTKIQASGEYTEEPVNMLYVLVSKYEIHKLRVIISKHDPHAFVVVKGNAMIYGNYLKKF